MVWKTWVSSRAKHWFYCHRCCEAFDHHCTWLNNCIGRGNYGSFLGVMISLEIHWISLIISIVIVINDLNENRDPLSIDTVFNTTNEIPFYIVYFIVTLWSAGLVTFNTGLICFHIRLCCNNITTFDYVIAKRALRGVLRRNNNKTY